MKKTVVASLSISGYLIFSLFLLSFQAKAQDTTKTSAPLPDDINKIVTTSCMPCHSNQGGLMSKTKLNFTEWTNYSPEKQKEKAAKMFSELNKGEMPPKNAREKRPDLIPDSVQILVIKKWAESFPPENKQ